MLTVLHLGSTPESAACVALGDPAYETLGRYQLQVFKRMLERRLPVPEDCAASYRIVGCPHDFGIYHEVAVEFDTDDPCATAFAHGLEDQLPYEWDDEATADLSASLRAPAPARGSSGHGND